MNCPTCHRPNDDDAQGVVVPSRLLERGVLALEQIVRELVVLNLRRGGTLPTLILALVASQGCAFAVLAAELSPCRSYADTRYEPMRYTAYDVPRTTPTKRGIPVGPGVDGARVDALTAEVEACMGGKVRGCAIHAVMVAPDWRSLNGGPQVFPCADQLDGWCHGINQWPATIVTTPDLHAFKWELVRMLTKSTPTRCT